MSYGKRGHDDIAVKEQADLVGLSDEELIHAANSLERAVVTENIKDFAAIGKRITADGQRHSGLVFTHHRQFPCSAGDYVQELTGARLVFHKEHTTTLQDVQSFVWWLRRAS